MKISSVKMPQSPFEIVADHIIFIDNVIPRKEIDGVTGQPVTVWDYDRYAYPVKPAPNLEAEIESDYPEWLQKAKDLEYSIEADKVRTYRDKLLNDCDVKYCNCEKWDLMDETKKAAWRTYKQALRDVSLQDGFPYAVTFPKLPYEEV